MCSLAHFGGLSTGTCGLHLSKNSATRLPQKKRGRFYTTPIKTNVVEDQGTTFSFYCSKNPDKEAMIGCKAPVKNPRETSGMRLACN